MGYCPLNCIRTLIPFENSSISLSLMKQKRLSGFFCVKTISASYHVLKLLLLPDSFGTGGAVIPGVGG